MTEPPETWIGWQIRTPSWMHDRWGEIIGLVVEMDQWGMREHYYRVLLPEGDLTDIRCGSSYQLQRPAWLMTEGR